MDDDSFNMTIDSGVKEVKQKSWKENFTLPFPVVFIAKLCLVNNIVVVRASRGVFKAQIRKKILNVGSLGDAFRVRIHCKIEQ